MSTYNELKQMKERINLNASYIFCGEADYDSSLDINRAIELKRQGKYVEAFRVYLALYERAQVISEAWVRGAFKVLACGGAIMEAYDLLMAFTNHFIAQKVSNPLLMQLRVHQIAIVMCVLGYRNMNGFEQYSLHDYLASLSGNAVGFRMPNLDHLKGGQIMMLPIHMEVYEKSYPNLVSVTKDFLTLH